MQYQESVDVGATSPQQVRESRDLAYSIMQQLREREMRQGHYTPDGPRPPPRGRGIMALRAVQQAMRDLREEGKRRISAMREGELRGGGERKAKEDHDVRKARNPMGPPSYNEGGMTYERNVAPEIAPWAADTAGRAQQYGAMNPFGTPQQQAAWQGQQIYGMGQGPQATRDAYQTMTGGVQGFIDPQVAMQERMIREAEARQLQGVGSQAAQAGGFGGSRHGLAEQDVRQGTREQIGNLGAMAYSDAFGRQMQQAGGLASLGGQQQNQQMQRLGMLGQASSEQAMWPYQNLQQQTGIMGALPYENSMQQTPTQGQGFWGSFVPTFLEGVGGYQEWRQNNSTYGGKNKKQGNSTYTKPSYGGFDPGGPLFPSGK